MKDNQTKKAIILTGPTSSGKTKLAQSIFDHFPVDILSVDSAMIYKGMNIGTAKPSSSELQKYPHKLIDLVDPKDTYSVGQFCEDAVKEMEQSHAQGKTPVLVGGTMMYLNALLNGLADLPTSTKSVRDELNLEFKKHGSHALHERLARIDPESSLRIHQNDTQRIQRALEVYLSTGKTLSWYLKQPNKNFLEGWDILPIVVNAPKETLDKKIANRFHSMLNQGLIDEVKSLYERGDLHSDLPSMRSVGYKQVWDYLEGNYEYKTLIERSVIATRQLAKRQNTWLRKIAVNFHVANDGYCNNTHSLVSNFVDAGC